MDRNTAGAQETVAHQDAVAATVQAGAAGIRQGFVTLDAQREIAFEEFVGHVGETRPQRMAIRAIAERLAGNAAETDLEQLEPLAVLARPLVTPGIHQVRRRRESSRA